MVYIDLESISTSVTFYSLRISVVFVYEAKEGWVVILAIITPACNEFKKKNGIFTKKNLAENPLLLCTKIQ